MTENIPEQSASQKNLILAIIFASLVVGGSLIFLGSKLSGPSSTAELLKDNPKLAELVEQMKKEEEKGKITAPYEEIVENDAIHGSENAAVTLVEFSDYQCPFCRRHFTQTLPQLEKNFISAGKLKYLFRDFPLSFHADAMGASMAAECARDQKDDAMYFKMHDKIFEGQQKLGSGTVDIPPVDLRVYAKNLKLNMNDFETCMTTEKFKDEIQKDIVDGSRFGVEGTPGFVVTNGKTSKLISGAVPYSVFESEINALLQ